MSDQFLSEIVSIRCNLNRHKQMSQMKYKALSKMANQIQRVMDNVDAPGWEEEATRILREARCLVRMEEGE